MITNKSVPITDPAVIARLLATPEHARASGWSTMASPAEDALRPSNQSLILRCTKCSVNTSGMYAQPTDTVRRCPSCNSLLMYCTSCHATVSATEKFSVLTCDRCHVDCVTNSTIEYLVSRDRTAREVVLSGIRATGRLHLGNFMGAVQQFVEYDTGDNLCLYFIADWHTLTTCQEPEKIRTNSVAIAMDYLAAGLNPERAIIYAQSDVPELAELALYLAMIQPKNSLERLPTLKDIVRGGQDMSLGHLHYPVLMAADILGPKATLVPVGSDQVPHIELARDIATRFNSLFGQTFVMPRAGIKTIKVPGLRGEKMGKSDDTASITLDDSFETINAKYQRFGVTDPGRTTRTAPGNPDNCASVYPVFRLLLEKDDTQTLNVVSTECQAGTRGCRECKAELAGRINDLITPFRERRTKLAENEKFVREVLHFGGVKAREIIRPTLLEVRERMGIISV